MTADPTLPARWIHHDQQLSAHLESGLARARAGDWRSGLPSVRAAEWQAIVVDTAYQMAKLGGSVSTVAAGGDETLYLDPRPGPGVSEPRRRAMSQLYRTLDLLAQGEQSSDAETFADPGSEVSGLPAVAIVALIVVGGAAIAYCGQQAFKVIDRQLDRDARAAELAAAHAVALDVVDRHTAREDAAGQPLPLDAASRAALDALAVEQEKIAGRALPDFGDFGSGSSSPFNFGTGALVGLAAVVALLVVTKTGVF